MTLPITDKHVIRELLKRCGKTEVNETIAEGGIWPLETMETKK